MRRLLTTIAAGACAFAPAALAAQSLAARVNAAPADAVLRFSFPARPNVCGDGDAIMIIDENNRHNVSFMRGNFNRNDDARFDDQGRLRNCQYGPVTVELQRSNGRITDADVRVGGPARTGDTDLGSVTAADAVDYLLSERAVDVAREQAANQMIFAATLAPVESWPALLRLARTQNLGERTRSTAMFWLANAAGEKAAEGLQSIVGDNSDELAVRKQAVFALSRINSEATVPRLIEIARTNREPGIRKDAMFWLGRSKDPRALDFFERILAGR